MNAIKLAPDGAIEGYAIRYGSPNETDQAGDYFHPGTDLMLDAWGFPRPITVDHYTWTRTGRQAGIVGQWHGASKDTIGVRMRGALDTRHPMFPQLRADIQAGRYYLSSDSAPQFVKVTTLIAPTKYDKGVHRLDTWGLLSASLTKTPCEKRLLPVEMIKALHLKQGARHSAGDQRAIQDAHDALVTAGAMCSSPAKSDRQRAARIERELKMLEDDIALERWADIDLELDDLELQLRLENELDALERSIRR